MPNRDIHGTRCGLSGPGFCSMPAAMSHAAAKFARLVDIIARLRAPGGCPWDRAQTPQTLRPYLVEETYEVLDALDAEDWTELQEELGDVLLQVVLHAQLMAEAGRFGIADVVESIAEKMVRRHPHVFGDATAESPDEVSRNWARIKAAEKRAKAGAAARDDAERSVLDGVPKSAPALIQAQRLGEKAAKVGFDWPSAAEVFDKVDEESRELLAEINRADAGNRQRAMEHELGDLLFTLTSLARHLDLDAESALRKANARFGRRFRFMEAQLARGGEDMHAASASRLEAWWQAAKQRVG